MKDLLPRLQRMRRELDILIEIVERRSATPAKGKGKFWSREERDELTRLWNIGASLHRIAASLSRSKGAVQRQRKYLGLTPRPATWTDATRNRRKT